MLDPHVHEDLPQHADDGERLEKACASTRNRPSAEPLPAPHWLCSTDELGYTLEDDGGWL